MQPRPPYRPLASAHATVLPSDIVATRDFPFSPVQPEAARPAWLRHVRAMPILETPHAIVAAMADPLDQPVCQSLAFAFGKPIEPRTALPADI